MKAVVFIDVQNDFVLHNGALPVPGAEDTAKKIIDFAKKCRSRGYAMFATADTHKPTEYGVGGHAESGYLATLEGRRLPVEHCIEGADGHKIVEGLVKDENRDVIIPEGNIVDKTIFGASDLPPIMKNRMLGEFREPIEEIFLCGFCTGICVLTNAGLLRSKFPDTKISVVSDLCGDLTQEDHERALESMKRIMVDVVKSEEVFA